jgi:hypothetical protein
LTRATHSINVIPVSSTLIPAGQEDHEAAGGCAWMAAWAAVCTFTLGATLVLVVVLTGHAGAYGVAALGAMLACSLGVVMLVPAAILWTGHQLRNHPGRRWRTAVALVPLLGAVALLSWIGAGLLGWPGSPVDSAVAPVAGVTLLALSAVLVVEPEERHPAWAFAALWVAFIGILSYRVWTDLRVEVGWLGPSVVQPTPGVIGFSATRSGDVEVRFGAQSCGDGRLIATGRYTWRPDDPRSSYGATMWVDLPADVLPLQRGDLVRVCVRDGLAGGTAAGEVVEPPSFWPRD